MASFKCTLYISILVLIHAFNAIKLRYAPEKEPNAGTTELSYVLDVSPSPARKLRYFMHVSMISRQDNTSQRNTREQWYELTIPSRRTVRKGNTLTFQIVGLMNKIKDELGDDIKYATIQIKVEDRTIPSHIKPYISDYVNINDDAVETPRLGYVKQMSTPRGQQTIRRSDPKPHVHQSKPRAQRAPQRISPRLQQQTIQSLARSNRPASKLSSDGVHALNVSMPVLNLTNAQHQTSDQEIYNVDDIERTWREHAQNTTSNTNKDSDSLTILSSDSDEITVKPTKHPTKQPTLQPTLKPTLKPTQYPTMKPTLNPTQYPTITTLKPTLTPTNTPTDAPGLFEYPLAFSAAEYDIQTTRVLHTNKSNPLARELPLRIPVHVNQYRKNKNSGSASIFTAHPIYVVSFVTFITLIICILVIYKFRGNLCLKIYSCSTKGRLERQIVMDLDDNDDAFEENTDKLFIYNTSISKETSSSVSKKEWIQGTL